MADSKQSKTQQASARRTAAKAAADPSKFEIPETVKTKYPDLIPLILETESMNDDERQYWFQILPIMTDDQVAKLREILQNEKKQLADLDREYDDGMKQINAKQASQFKAIEAAEKRKKMKAEETQSEEQEKTTEEELLHKLHSE